MLFGPLYDVPVKVYRVGDIIKHIKIIEKSVTH